MRYSVIVNMNIEYEVDADSALESIQQVEILDLPHWYVEGSFELVKVIDDKQNEYDDDWELITN